MPNSPNPSGNGGWTTPKALFEKLDAEFHFDTDVAASAENALCKRFITAEQDAFKTAWGARSFCNPPYGNGEKACRNGCKKKRCEKRGFHVSVDVPGIYDWVERAIDLLGGNGTRSVLLVPAATDAGWFHHAVQYAKEVRLLRGRLAFGNVVCKDGSVGEVSAPFPSTVIVFSPRMWGTSCHIKTWDWRA